METDPFSGFNSRRSAVHSTKGIVSSTSPLASQAGVRILREGGNAADAAVAAAPVLNVVEPAMTGIGGDAFCLFYDAGSRAVSALNGSGRSPAAATLEAVCRDLGVEVGATSTASAIPRTSPHSVTVPGAAAAWVDTVEKFGSGSVSLAQVLAPAIELAEEGGPIGDITSLHWLVDEDKLLSAPNGCDMLKEDSNVPGGYRAPRPEELYRNPLLADTFRRLAEQGKSGFYEGPVAEAIIDATSSRGGFLSPEDLKFHADRGSEISKAISVRFHNCLGAGNDPGPAVDLWEHPPNG